MTCDSPSTRWPAGTSAGCCAKAARLLGEMVVDGLLDDLCLTFSPLLRGGDAPRALNGAPTAPRRMRLAHVLEEDGTLLTDGSARQRLFPVVRGRGRLRNALPVMPPVAPMLAKSVAEIPDVGHIEPKWDGFRTIVFRDGDEVELGSRNERPMTRYFPEVVEAVKANLPQRCVVDGEIVVIRGDRLDFESLQQRIHPAASRVNLLARETPASFIAFDLLAIDDESLMDVPFGTRRARLVEPSPDTEPPVHLTPATADLTTGVRWLAAFEGAGLDVVAKPLDGPYVPDKRTMFKIKHERTADCVVAGFRWHKSGGVIGSLLLGLYDDDGALQHVGVSASFPMARRA